MSTAAARQTRIDEALTRVLSKKKVVKEEDEDDFYATGVKADRVGLKATNTAIDQILHGVTVGFLAQLFNMNNAMVKSKLRDCPPIHRRKNGFIYDLKLAARYLVPPVVNVEEHLRTARIDELPLRLQTEYWSAQKKRREHEEATGQLWRTEDVVMVLGEVFQTVKHSAMLLPATLERTANMNEKQVAIVTKAIDNLLDEIYSKLRKMKAAPKTKSVLAYDEEEAQSEKIVTAGPSVEDYYANEVAQDLEGEEEIPDDYSHLV